MYVCMLKQTSSWCNFPIKRKRKNKCKKCAIFTFWLLRDLRIQTCLNKTYTFANAIIEGYFWNMRYISTRRDIKHMQSNQPYGNICVSSSSSASSFFVELFTTMFNKVLNVPSAKASNRVVIVFRKRVCLN